MLEKKEMRNEGLLPAHPLLGAGSHTPAHAVTRN